MTYLHSHYENGVSDELKWLPFSLRVWTLENAFGDNKFCLFIHSFTLLFRRREPPLRSIARIRILMATSHWRAALWQSLSYLTRRTKSWILFGLFCFRDKTTFSSYFGTHVSWTKIWEKIDFSVTVWGEVICTHSYTQESSVRNSLTWHWFSRSMTSHVWRHNLSHLRLVTLLAHALG